MSVPETMQALMLTDIGRLELVEVPIPTISRPDEVLVRVRAAGICGSDLHGYTGESGRRTPPLIMGHEVAGEVVEVGDAVGDFPPGTRVAIQPVAFCGTCSACVAGSQNVCEERRLMGMHAPGAYASYVAWPASNLFVLPDGLSYEAAALAEPLAVAIHAVARVKLRPDTDVLVAGTGPIGLLVVAVLRRAGVAKIFVSDMSAERRQAAISVGATFALDPTTEDVADAILARTGGRGVDVSFEAVGISATVAQTVAATRNRGQIVWIGNNRRFVEVDMQRIVTGELRVLGSYGMGEQDFTKALQMLVEEADLAQTLINRRAKLKEGPTLFDELLSSPEIFKCVFTFPTGA